MSWPALQSRDGGETRAGGVGAVLLRENGRTPEDERGQRAGERDDGACPAAGARLSPWGRQASRPYA